MCLGEPGAATWNSTYGSDGVEINTNTNRIESPLFPTPNRRVFHFPQIHDVFTLYRVHRKLVDGNVRRGYPVLPPHGREVSEWRRRQESYGPWQQARGYMHLDGRNRSYRLTWKGAMIGGWRSIWPVPFLYAWQMKRQSEATLRKVGVALPESLL